MKQQRAIYPFLPAFCTICRRSASIGRGRGPYTYYCQECSEMPAATTRKLDEYEKTALLAVDETAGGYAADHGTDIGEWSEEQRMGLWLVALRAWEASMKEQAAGGGAPF